MILRTHLALENTYELHIQWLDRVLASLERAGCTISGEKSQFCMDGINVVGYICGSNGRLPDTDKVAKIVEWPDCQDVSEARAFIGVCVYFRIWIENFATISLPIYKLFRRGISF